MQNQFYKVMNAYSDDELLAVYRDRSTYTPEAIEAMEMVLSERKLLEDAAQIVVEQQEEETLSKELLLENFERSTFGKVISDTDFAKERLDGSLYFDRFISPLHNYNRLNHLFIIVGITCLTIAMVILGIGDFSAPFPTLLSISIPLAVLLPFGIWKLSKNKARLTIVKKMNRNVIMINEPKEQYEIEFPVRYEKYWEWTYVRKGQLKLKQVQLTLFLYDDVHNSCYVLRQLIELHKPPPPHWEMLPKRHTTNKSFNYTYLNHGFQKPFLYEFQKILDGLNQEK